MQVKFNGYDQLNGNHEHPNKGLVGELVKRFGMSCAGYDALVSLDLNETVAAYAAASEQDDNPWTAAQWLEWFKLQEWIKGDKVEVEANFEEELEVLDG